MNSKLSSFLHTYPWKRIRLFLLACVFAGLLFLPGEARSAPPQQEENREFVVLGLVIDPQGQPVPEADVRAMVSGLEQPFAETKTQDDGSWQLSFDELPVADLEIIIDHAHFEQHALEFNAAQRNRVDLLGVYRYDDLILERRISTGFWVATITFVAILLLIAFEVLHSTTAALAGASTIFLISYIGGAFNEDLFIFTFERALSYINWEVIFLVFAMMIIIAIIEGTGIFQWMAFQSYRISGGRSWLLVLILMAITAVASALLDNFTTMLLMTPISLQIGIALGINPLALIIPEVLASNVGGISTLVGTPTNILIGAHAGIGFNDFLVNQTIGVLAALVVMGAYVLFHYRKELKKHGAGLSDRLYKKLEENAQLNDPDALWKSGLIFIVVLVGFVLGEQVHMVPAVPAMAGATLLLVWLKPDVTHMIRAVDWTTLVFFMALFMVVGSIQEVGLISMVAAQMAALIGEDLALGIFVIVFGVGTISVAIANIPLAASMLPVIDFLSGTIPGANSKVLYYALSMGAAMGGNGLLIGGEANLVTAGITSQTSSPITFKEFLKVGLPVTYLTLAVGFIWLLVRFA